MITARFGCGHTVSLSGNEKHPRCACGNDALIEVKAPAPRFKGLALGPCAQFEALEAIPVTLKKEND